MNYHKTATAASGCLYGFVILLFSFSKDSSLDKIFSNTGWILPHKPPKIMKIAGISPPGCRRNATEKIKYKTPKARNTMDQYLKIFSGFINDFIFCPLFLDNVELWRGALATLTRSDLLALPFVEGFVK